MLNIWICDKDGKAILIKDIIDVDTRNVGIIKITDRRENVYTFRVESAMDLFVVGKVEEVG